MGHRSKARDIIEWAMEREESALPAEPANDMLVSRALVNDILAKLLESNYLCMTSREEMETIRDFNGALDEALEADSGEEALRNLGRNNVDEDAD